MYAIRSYYDARRVEPGKMPPARRVAALADAPEGAAARIDQPAVVVAQLEREPALAVVMRRRVRALVVGKLA